MDMEDCQRMGCALHAWFSMVWWSVWYGMVRYGMAWYGVWYSIVRYGMVPTAWYGVICYSMIWHGMVWS